MGGVARYAGRNLRFYCQYPSHDPSSRHSRAARHHRAHAPRAAAAIAVCTHCPFTVTAALMRTFRYLQLDVFSNRPGAGNPLGVVVDAGALSAQQMQQIAAWLNL